MIFQYYTLPAVLLKRLHYRWTGTNPRHRHFLNDSILSMPRQLANRLHTLGINAMLFTFLFTFL